MTVTTGTLGSMPDPSDDSGITVQLGLTLSRVADSSERLCRRLDDMAATAALLPNWVPITSTQTVPSPAGPFVIDMGGPQPGRFWMIRNLTVSDSGSVRNAISGTTFADWYVGKPPVAGPLSTSNLVAPNQWVASQSNLPQQTFVSSEQIRVWPQNHLFVVITGATTVGQQIMATSAILDVAQATYSATFNI